MKTTRRKATKINDPGVREIGDDAMVIQMAKRSAQLNSISENIKKILDAAQPTAPGRIGEYVAVSETDAHKITGWMEQVGIISDELAAAGK